MDTIKCKSCGGLVVDGKQKYHHQKMCVGYKEEGVDHLVCLECGYKSPTLVKHLLLHGMTFVDYRIKHGDVPVQLQSMIDKRNKSNIGTHVIPVEKRVGAVFCDKCNEWYLKRFSRKHLEGCVFEHPDKYVEGKDYVKCPECGKAFLSIGKHLRNEHGWDNDKIVIESGRGLKLLADNIKEKTGRSTDYKKAQKKREKTHLERHGFSNPFADPSTKKKMVETNQRRYGADHAMKTEEILIRQNRSAQRGPSGQEVFFDENTCDNVVYTGQGSRFIRTKKGVRKYGRLIKDLNPDFMVLPDKVLKSAQEAIRDGRPLDRQKHRTRYVVELLGDWFHSEKMIGVNPEEHKNEIVEAYKSVGIDCLVLWEHDVIDRWDEIRGMVDEWVKNAIQDTNDNPVYK